MTYRDRYVELFRRHLDCEQRVSDGLSETAVKRCERRLGSSLPKSLRAYYLTAGKLDQLNKAHNLLFTPQLRVEEAHLWFMEESQAVVHWGLPAKRLSAQDPVAWQRANVDGAGWYSEKRRFSDFLLRMYDWQTGFADAPG